MAAFWSTYTNKIDRKGRVSIPALFRKPLIGPDFQGVVVFPGLHSTALECRSWEQMDKLAETVDQLPEFSLQRDTLAVTIFGSSTPLSFDTEGRITLPQNLIEHAGLSDEVAFVGLGRTFQMWQPEALAQFQQEARARAQREGIVLPRKPEGGAA
jgi:MraZ protein